MCIIKKLTRLGAISAILGIIAAAFAGPAFASTSLIPLPGGGGGPDGGLSQPTVVHLVVVGGMPGWQIALIAILAAAVAAVVAAVAAVLVDRARSARRQPLGSPA